jgi:deoxyribose-phosphate aldolase
MKLTPNDIARMLDHSTLQPFLTEADIRHGAEVALKYHTASMCARPCDVPLMAELLRGSDVKVCTVIGFPHGAHQTQIKVAEAALALDEGCEELDMVINIGRMLAGDEAYVREEIRRIVELAHARGAIVKVIIETCYLSDAQKKRACELSEEAGADFVKTSTGYGTKGCTIEDLKLMRAAVSDKVRVKGSGGIRDLDTVLAARAAGASRCGVSATEKIMAEAEERFAQGTLEA